MVHSNWNIGQEISSAQGKNSDAIFVVLFCVVLRKQRILFVDDAVEAKFHDWLPVHMQYEPVFNCVVSQSIFPT